MENPNFNLGDIPQPPATVYNPLVLAADNYNLESGEKSWIDSSKDALTYGLHGAFLSGVNSFINTGVEVANWFGAGLDKSDTYQDLLNSGDLNAADYYAQHKTGVDLAGFAAGSMIPGFGGLKVFQLAKAGLAGDKIASAVGFFSTGRDALIKSTLDLIEKGVPSVDSTIRINKLKALALGFGDNAVSAAVWETAVQATMGASPTLENQDWRDITLNIGTAGILGGALGGIWDAFGAQGIFKKAQVLSDMNRRVNEVYTNLGKGDFLPGDRAVELLDSLNKIPLPPTEEAAADVFKTYKRAVDQTKIILGKIAPDETVANSFLDRLLYMRDQAKISSDEMYEYLAGAKRIERVGEADQEAKTTFYAKKEATLDDPFTQNPEEGKAQAYQLKNEQVKPVVTTNAQYASASDAFGSGADIFLDEKGVPHVNPKAPNIQIIPKPGFTNLAKTEGAPIIVNLRTGAVTDTAIPTIGDLATPDAIKLINSKQALQAGDKIYNFTPTSYQADLYSQDYLRANARYIWASQRGIQANDVININDLPMLDSLARTVATKQDSATQKILATVKLTDGSGQKKSLAELTSGQPIGNFVEGIKRQAINDYFQNLGKQIGTNGLPVGEDLRKLALRFNVPEDFFQGGMPRTLALDDISVNPETYLRPNYAKVIYDVGNPVKDIDGMVARGMVAVQGRIDRAKDLAATVATNFFKDFDEQFPLVDPAFSQYNANSLGAGPSAVGFSNADYGTVGELYESIGAATHLILQSKTKATLDQLAHGILNITKNEESAAELGIITNILRGSAEKYVLIPDTNYMVLKQLAEYVNKMQVGGITRIGFKNGAESLLPEGYFLRIPGDQGEEILPKGKYAAYKVSDDVRDFLDTSTQLNDLRLQHHNNFLAAQGITRKIEQGTVYAPPIDTRKYNYWALVRDPQGNGASSSSVASVTAASESELATKIAMAKDAGYEVYTKADIKTHHKVLGDYDYNLNMTENLVDSDLKRRGILSNFYPETRADRVLDDWTTWHKNQETRLVRNMVELKYAQQFAELRDLGQKYVDLATSRVQNINQFLRSTAENPYDDYIKLALDLPKTSEYRLWADANEKVEAFFDSGFRFAKQAFTNAQNGIMSFEDANNLAQKYGMGKPFVTAADYLESQGMLAPKPYLRTFIQKVNSLMSATTLRLDSMQALINTISTPILLGHEVQVLKRSITDPESLKNLNELLTMELPGDAATRIPATSKLLFNAVKNYFSADGKALIDQYQKTGLDLSLLRQQQEMLGTLSFTGKELESQLNQKFSAAAQIGEKLTGNTFAESFTRFVSADAMRQILDTLGVQDSGVRLSMMRTFVNRVQGNYIASQRPVAFQGVLGQAMALFQTYQFNLMQQLFHSVEAGDKKALATLFGLQSTLYGMNGVPLFSALNTHIIGNAPGNTTHQDVYSAIPQLVGKQLGDFLMYGGASWATNAALYSRGDINPRQITVLPINPTDWPAISGVTKFVGDVMNVGKKLADGGNFVNTMLEGLEHNSLSRPLAGLAQVVQGYSTTTQGDLISRTNEVSAIANAARMLGAKPLDEAIALDALYRKTAYQAKDSERLKQLGQAVKTTFIGGGVPGEADLNKFAMDYAASGGHIDHFNRFLIDAMKNTSQSNVNRFMQNLRNPVAKNMMEIMGGNELPDYTNIANTGASIQ